MLRNEYYLKDDKRKNLPRCFIFFDVETIPEKISETEEKHNFRLGVAVYYERRNNKVKDTEIWLEFKDISSFWDFVEKRAKDKRILYLVAHNVNFDFRVLKGFEQLKNRGWALDKFLANNNVSIYTYKKDKKKLRIIDSMNYFNFSLAQLGEMIGVNKLETPKFEESDDVWLKYCKNDVLILLVAFKRLIEMIKSDNMGRFGLTLARQSLNLFLRKYYKTKIYIRRNKFIDDFERKAYYGGRVECFKIGCFRNDTFYNLDVNSLYPYIMKNISLPYRLVGIFENVKLLELEDLLNKYSAIAQVIVKTDSPIYPLRYENKLIFPIGRFRTYLAGPELKEALIRKHLDKVEVLFLYLHKPLFQDFVKDIYQLRKKAKENKDNTLSMFYKLLLNSLYGKFGQRNDIWEFVDYNPSSPSGAWMVYDADDKKSFLYRCLDGKIEVSKGKTETKFTYYPIPAHITSGGRVYLYHLIEKANKENVYYCDTDSLFVNSKGYHNLKEMIDNSELGKLSIRKTADNLIIYGLKDYQFADEIKIKGIRKSAIKINDRVFIQAKFETIKGALRNGRLNEVVVEYIRKELKRNYNKGIVLKNGTINPIRIVI